MSHILTLVIILSAIVSCNKNSPIEPWKEYVPEPCYDSTYFDTSLPMFKTDMKWFYMELPIGSGGSAGDLGNMLGGGYSYGCDSFKFSYGSGIEGISYLQAWDTSLGWASYYEEFEINGDTAKIVFTKAGQGVEDAAHFTVRRSSDEEIWISARRGTHYKEMAIKVFHSFEYK